MAGTKSRGGRPCAPYGTGRLDRVEKVERVELRFQLPPASRAGRGDRLPVGAPAHSKPILNSLLVSFAVHAVRIVIRCQTGVSTLPVEMLTYAELGERLKVSPEAARSLVKRHRFPRSRSNDGKTLVQVDLTEISHSPVSRGPQGQAGHQAVTALKQQIETLRAELAEMNAVAKGHRADFEREYERTNKLLAELLKAGTEAVEAREKAALLEGKLSVLSQPLRRRLVEAFALALPQAASSVRECGGRLIR